MSANVRLNWSLPTARTDGAPLPPDAIDFVRVEVKHAEASDWDQVDDFGPETLTALLPDTPSGTWQFRGTVFPVDGPESAPRLAEVVVPLAAAGALPTLEATLEE